MEENISSKKLKFLQVKDTQFTWKETRRSLRKDPRWSALDVLDKAEKESLFNSHIEDIKDKRKKGFRKLLDKAEVCMYLGSCVLFYTIFNLNRNLMYLKTHHNVNM